MTTRPTKREYVSAGRARWLRENSNLNDRDRAALTAAKFLLLIQMWERVRTRAPEWLKSADFMDLAPSRQTRRFMHKLAATGLCELSYGGSNVPMRIRLMAATVTDATNGKRKVSKQTEKKIVHKED